MHIYTSNEEKKLELQMALIEGFSVVLVPRPWPSAPEKHFMPSDIAKYLKKNGFDTSKLSISVFEHLSTENESCFEGCVKDLEGKDFSDFTVMVFKQTKLESYIDLKI